MELYLGYYAGMPWYRESESSDKVYVKDKMNASRLVFSFNHIATVGFSMTENELLMVFRKYYYP